MAHVCFNCSKQIGHLDNKTFQKDELIVFEAALLSYNHIYHEVVVDKCDLIEDKGELEAVSAVMFDIGEEVEESEEVVVGLLEVSVRGRNEAQG